MHQLDTLTTYHGTAVDGRRPDLTTPIRFALSLRLGVRGPSKCTTFGLAAAMDGHEKGLVTRGVKFVQGKSVRPC
jgi:hypothetical protein